MVLRVLLLLALALAASAQTVTVTAGRLTLTKDGATLSTHTDQTGNEAVEKAINFGPGTYLLKRPDVVIVVAKPVVISSLQCEITPASCPAPIVYYAPCVTAECRKPAQTEIAAHRALIAHGTAEWVKDPVNLARMHWPPSGLAQSGSGR